MFQKIRRNIFVNWCHFWIDRSYKRRSRRERNRVVKQAIHFNRMITDGKITGRRCRSVVLGGRRY